MGYPPERDRTHGITTPTTMESVSFFAYASGWKAQRTARRKPGKADEKASKNADDGKS